MGDATRLSQVRPALPWRMLVAPASAWDELRSGPAWLAALLMQFLLSALAATITMRPLMELEQASSAQKLTQLPLWQALLLELGVLVLAVPAANLLIALGLQALLATFGSKPGFKRAFTLTAYSVIPFILGLFLDSVLFSIVQPLADTPVAAMALRLRPFSLGLATFLPGFFPPLSLSWFLASYIDGFTCWSVYVLALGGIRYLALSRSAAYWFALSVMLSLALVLTGVWQLVQQIQLLLGG